MEGDSKHALLLLIEELPPNQVWLVCGFARVRAQNKCGPELRKNMDDRMHDSLARFFNPAFYCRIS